MARNTRLQVDYGADDAGALAVRRRGIQSPTLRPLASPVDTFVRPAAPNTDLAGAKFAQLAQALTSFAPGLARYAQAQDEQENQRQQQEGQNLASELALQGETYRKAVEKGLIPESANPFFVAGVREQFGRVTADAMAEAFRVKLLTDPDLKESVDPADFDAAAQQFTREWVDTNVGKRDRFFDNGFSGRAAAQLQDVRRSFDSRVAENLGSMSINGLYSEASRHINDSWGKVPTADIIAGLQGLREDMIAQGRNVRLVDRTLFRSILETAKRNRSLDMLSVADDIVGHEGVPLSQYDAEKSEDELLAARATIVRENTAEMQLEDSQRRKAEAKRADDAFSGAIRRLRENPSAAIDDIADGVADLGPDAYNAVLRARDMARAAVERDNPVVERQLFVKVFGEGTGTNRDVMRAFNNGHLTLATAGRFLDYVSERDSRNRQSAAMEAQAVAQARAADAAERQGYRDIVTDPTLQSFLATLDTRFPKGYMGAVDPAVGEAQAYAKAEIQRAWAAYALSTEYNPQNIVATNAWLEQTTNAIVKRYQAQTPAGQMGGTGMAAPKPEGASTKAKPVVSRADLDAFWGGKESETTRAIFARLNLFTAKQKAEYMTEQLRLHNQQGK